MPSIRGGLGPRSGVILLLALLASALLRSEARSEDLFSQEKCSLCHIRESVFFNPSFADREKGREFDEERVCMSCHNGSVADGRSALWRGAQHPPLPRPGGKRCSPCHNPHGKGGWGVLAGTSAPLRRGDGACQGCHKDRSSAGSQLHRKKFPEGGCSECHRAHGGAGKTLLREGKTVLCLRCHGNLDPGRTGGHPFDRDASRAAAAKSLPECTGCHPVHKAAGEDNVAMRACAGCHPFASERAASRGKAHPGEDGCSSCHVFHRGTAEGGRSFRGKGIRPELLCGGCHKDLLAEDAKASRAKGTHITRRPRTGEELCTLCHRIHRGTPGTALLATEKEYSCLACHEGQNTINEAAGIALAHPVFERVGKGRLREVASTRRLVVGPAGEIVCRTCHRIHGATRETPLLTEGSAGDASCHWCHEGMRERGHRLTEGAKNIPGCATCHPVHGKRGAGVDPWATLCNTCHERSASHLTAVGDRSPGRPGEMPGFDAKGRKLKTGAISCPTCHDPHGEATAGKRLRRVYAPSGFMCTACHREKESIALTPHDLRGIAGKSICEPCHVPHGGSSPWMWGTKTGTGEKGEESCRSCHRESGIGSPVARGGHPVNLVVSRAIPDSFKLYGPESENRGSAVLSCPTCHEPHGTGVYPQGYGVQKMLRIEKITVLEEAGRTASCTPCHEGKRSLHGQADCIWCHPPHEETKGGPACETCHPRPDKGMAKMHEKGGKGCGTCHRIHQAGPGNPARPQSVCIGCHPKTERILDTTHADLGGGACEPCHPAHANIEGSLPKRRAWEELFPPDFPCLRCHREDGDGSLPQWIDHPKSRKTVPTNYGAVVTLEFPIVMVGHMQEGGRPVFPLFGEDGKPALSGRLGCITCHDPHAGHIIESEGGRSAGGYLRDPSGVFLSDICKPCHPGSAGDHVQKFHDLKRKID